MKNEIKKLCFIDSEKQSVVEYHCKLKEGVDESSILSFNNSLYRMKLDSNLSKIKFLHDGKFTVDLITEFSKVLKSDVIDFGGVLALYSSEKFIESDIVREPIRRFLGFFDFVDKKEHPIEDIKLESLFANHPSFKDSKEAERIKKHTKSIRPNTMLFKNNSSQNYIRLSSELKGVQKRKIPNNGKAKKAV